MATKVNLTYWDGTITDYNSWAEGCKYVDNQLYKLIDDDKWDIANNETFDLSVCPWGLPQCSLSSTANATYMKTQGFQAIVKLDEGGLRNAPFYIKREATANKVRTSTTGDTRTDLKLRVIGDTTKRTGSTTSNVKYTTSLDTGDHAAGSITTLSQPIVSLDYQTARLCGTSVRLFDINKTDNFSNCHKTLSKMSDLLTFAAADPDEKFRVVWAPTVFTNSEDNTDRLYPVICKPYKIPDFLQAQYYNSGTTEHLYLNRDMLSIGHEDGQADNYPNYGTSYFTGSSQYGNFLATQYSDKQLNFGCNGHTNNYCNASSVRQRFDDVSYHWESHLYYFEGGAGGSGVRTEFVDGSQLPSFTSSKYFVAECYLVIDSSVYGDYYTAAYYALMHEMAFMGFPFTDSLDTASDEIGDMSINVPVFDTEHMLTTGEYKSGSAALDLPNAEWEDIFDTSVPAYDPNYIPPEPPGPGPGPDPDPGTTDLLPQGLQFTMAGQGTGIWALTPSNITQVWDDIFGSKIKLEMFGNNPMNAILSLKWTPFDWSDVHNEEPIVLGDQVVNPLHTYPIIAAITKSEKHGEGSIKFNYDKNFYNARNIQARLFLPFYGYYELPVAQLLSASLRLDFYYNVPDELGVWFISYKQDNSNEWVVYDYCECSVDIDVPLTGSNAAAIKENKRTEALTIATQVAGMGVATAVGWSGIKNVASGVSQIGAAAAESAWAYSNPISAAIANVGPLAGEGLLGGMGAGLAGIASGALGGGSAIANTVKQAQIQRANLKTNLPYHGSALQTTFLHLSMQPYVQIFKNGIMEGLEKKDGGTIKETLGGDSEAQYKLKVGHACNIFTTTTSMPDNSLLQTTGIADMNTTGLELAEIEELNAIVQSGFFK